MFRYFFLFSLIIACQLNAPLIVNGNSHDVSKFKNLILYKKAKFTGSLVFYYDQNNKKPNIECSYKNGLKEGLEKIWYVNSQLSSSRTYKEGVKVGSHKGWWENGNFKFDYLYNNKGEYSGKIMEWYPNGKLYKEFTYEKGKEEGSQKMWKLNGNIKANYVVINGERFGLIGLKKCDPVSAN